MDRLENKMSMYFAIIIVLLFVIIGTNCLLLSQVDNIITATNSDKEAWDEATIVVDGKEVIRGQIDYHYTNEDGEMTLYFSDGEIWTTRATNVVLQHHDAR